MSPLTHMNTILCPQLPGNKDPRVDSTSIRRGSVESMSNRCRSKGLCYLGCVASVSFNRPLRSPPGSVCVQMHIVLRCSLNQQSTLYSYPRGQRVKRNCRDSYSEHQWDNPCNPSYPGTRAIIRDNPLPIVWNLGEGHGHWLDYHSNNTILKSTCQ